jgi:hypothetical protein
LQIILHYVNSFFIYLNLKSGRIANHGGNRAEEKVAAGSYQGRRLTHCAMSVEQGFEVQPVLSVVDFGRY